VSYYAQAAQGQFSLLAQARPLDDWLADPATSPALKAKLQTVREIRRFAVTELGLPDNGSYRSYAQLDRPFVLWNVVAAPELSLKPRQWCFPLPAAWTIAATTASKMRRPMPRRCKAKAMTSRWRGAGLFHAGLVR
jgi:predicted aminopeptidase